jgi:ribosomal protein L11
MLGLRIRLEKFCPVLITVYNDKSFDFVIKTAPAAVQLLEASKAKKGAAEPNRQKDWLASNLGSGESHCRRQNA